MENQSSLNSQRVEQLRQSKLIIVQKISRLQELADATEAEITKLTGEEPAQPKPYSLLEPNEDICAAMLHKLVQDAELSCFPVWITPDHYAEIHQLADSSVIDDWISRGIVPPSDILEMGIRLIRDKLYTL